MKVVLDTNSIYDDWFFSSTNAQVLLKLTKYKAVKLYIPEIVVLETLNKYREKILEANPNINQLNLLLPVAQRYKTFDVEDAYEEYKSYLEEMLGEFGIYASPYQKITQQDILSRLFGLRKPFNKKKTSDTGYRDAILWEVILNQIVDNKDCVYFITNNVHDFCDEVDRSQLHSDFRAELLERELKPSAVVVCESISRWVREHGITLLEAANLAEALKLGTDDSFSLGDWFYDNREPIMSAITPKIYESLESISGVEEPSVTFIETPETIDVEDSRIIDEDQIYLQATIRTEISVDVFVDKMAYDSQSNFLPLMLRSDWNETYDIASLGIKLPLKIMAIFSKKSHTIESFEIGDIEIWGWCKHCGFAIYSDSAEACPECGRYLF